MGLRIHNHIGDVTDMVGHAGKGTQRKQTTRKTDHDRHDG